MFKDEYLIFTGLHIEDIGNDIKKIHELLVNTAEADKAFASNNDKKKAHSGSHGDLSDVHPVKTESQEKRKSGKSVATKNTKIKSKAQVSSPARPAFGTSYQVGLSLNGLSIFDSEIYT